MTRQILLCCTVNKMPSHNVVLLITFLQPLLSVYLFNYQNILFYQNNVSIHIAKLTQDWLKISFTGVVDWPACLNNLTPIENVWDVMVRDVCKDGRQYVNLAIQVTNDFVDELKRAVNKSIWY